MFPALNEGATAFRTAFQCSSVCPVSRFVPPRNCTDDTPMSARQSDWKDSNDQAALPSNSVWHAVGMQHRPHALQRGPMHLTLSFNWWNIL